MTAAIRSRPATRSQLALLPETDKVVSFDQVAGIVASLSAAIDTASPEQLKDLVKMLVQRVTTQQRAVASVEIVPAALPFFASQPNSLGATPDRLEPPNGRATDTLAWYAAR